MVYSTVRVELNGRFTVVLTVADWMCSFVLTVVPVDLHISGCPPTPRQLLEGLLALLETQCLT